MTRAYPSFDQQRANDRYINLAKVRADEDKIINAPADWIDQGKKTIHIPIDEAMAKEIDTLKAQPAQVGSALPVMTPPAPAPAKPAAAAPAAPAATASTNAAPASPVPPAKPNK